MKDIVIAAILMFTCFGGKLTAQNTIVIKGTVNGDLKGYDKVYVYGSNIKQDSAVINNGNFEFTVPYHEGMMPLLYDQYDAKVKGGVSPFPIVIDRPGTVYLKDVNISEGLQSGTISGIESAEECQRFDRMLDSINTGIGNALKKKYGNEPITRESSGYQAYAKEYEELSKKQGAVLVERFIKSHAASYSSVFILTNAGRRLLAVNDLERVYNMLSDNMKKTKGGQRTSDYINGVKRSSIGQHVKDFTVETPAGEAFSFSALKGKYVIIDFWASWCGPCVASFPHMKEIYKKYKSDQFEIFSISVDQSEQDWLKALKKHDLPWLQAHDTKNIAVSGFAVDGIPTLYMIDPTGKIILKEVGFDGGASNPMEKKLAELFGNRENTKKEKS